VTDGRGMFVMKDSDKILCGKSEETTWEN